MPLLAVFVVWGFGWQLFDDGPLANYVITGMIVAFLCLDKARSSALWVVYLYGAIMGLMTSGCGAMYAAQMDGYHFLCDKGTSLPISLITGMGALAAAGYLIVRKR